MFKKIVFIVIVVIFVIFLVQQSGEEHTVAKITIGDSEIEVELADTQEKRNQGLSEREFLNENGGMFFVFDEVGDHSFWMKDMNFSIDIIWVGEDLKIVDIEENVSPESFPHLFFSSMPIKYVLETNVGWAEKNNIQIGDLVDKNF
jgi:hypothetical protein